MVTISRVLARQLRAVFRRAGIGKSPATNNVLFQASAEGLRIRAGSPNVAIEYRISGSFDPANFTVPIPTLAKAEGKKDDPIELTILPDGQVAVSWVNASVPQREVSPSHPENFAVMPEPLQPLREGSPELFTALADATEVAAKDSVRYATNCLRLSGQRESIAATDGQQLLVQRGFHWPWDEDLLIVANRVFNACELPQDEMVNVGRTEDWVLFRVGNWTFWFKIEKEARFPRVEDLIQRPDAATATLSIDGSDQQFLIDNLPQLPADDVFHQPVTIDLNGHVAVRAKPADKETTTELVLTNSWYLGEPIRMNTNREFLRRAVRLGFSKVSIYGPNQPVQCHDEQRVLIWSLLDVSGAFSRSADGVRIESSVDPADRTSRPVPMQPKNRIAMIAKTNSLSQQAKSRAVSAESQPGEKAESETMSPIDSAIALRDSLRDTVEKTNNLIRSLKRQRQQSRLVQTTLNSLRQLQAVEK